ncbi:hypothetical protein GBAR_LOCUS17749 [Geodia barretti]|uniref:Uncharacterized protein n=1 Tax=Geodia barretti TaxID=519541 RepID=A0AA35SJI7_GEOBA|nr:hypothetical protein GBAR_LOCUS17749 [Geodia barretti]
MPTSLGNLSTSSARRG